MRKLPLKWALAATATFGMSIHVIAANMIKVDAEKIKAPISKYIYGQFIEHLGNCIYGGIWAEMLQDRKFYYPVTDEYNPWGTATELRERMRRIRMAFDPRGVLSPWAFEG